MNESLEYIRKTPETEEHDRFGVKVVEVLGDFVDQYGRDQEVDIECYPLGKPKFSLKSLLPEGWKLIRTEDENVLECDPRSKAIYYGKEFVEDKIYRVPEGEVLPPVINTPELRRRVFPAYRKVRETRRSSHIMRRGFLYALVHEFGHAHTYVTPPEREAQELVRIRTMVKLGGGSLDVLNKSDKNLYLRHEIQNERRAHTWALNTIERLSKQGVNLVPEYKSPEDLAQLADSALKTYGF